jgi:hypothetical protein
MRGLVFFALIPVTAVVQAEGSWSLEIAAGAAHNFSSTLSVEQSGESELEFDAEYETRAFEGPIYYAARVGWWRGSRAWELELIHHKIFVSNSTAEIEHFGVSHGYNFLMANYARNVHGFLIRGGGGVIIAHPETVIREKFSEPGYELTGPAGQVAAGRRFFFGNGFFFSVEAKLAFARAAVTIAEGEAKAPNVSLHGLFGFGHSF